MSAPASNQPAGPPQTPPDLCWRAHPARERPLAAVAAVVVVVALSGLVTQIAEHSAAGMAAATVLIVALRQFFFPTRFELTADAARAAGLFGRREIRWSEVRRIDVGARGAWLSPSPIRSFREHRRGVLLLFGAHRPAVLARLQLHRRDVAPPG